MFELSRVKAGGFQFGFPPALAGAGEFDFGSIFWNIMATVSERIGAAYLA